jgi:hypothetical protein
MRGRQKKEKQVQDKQHMQMQEQDDFLKVLIVRGKCTPKIWNLLDSFSSVVNA